MTYFILYNWLQRRKCLFCGPHCFSIPKEIIGRRKWHKADPRVELSMLQLYTAVLPLCHYPTLHFLLVMDYKLKNRSPVRIEYKEVWGREGGVRCEEKKRAVLQSWNNCGGCSGRRRQSKEERPWISDARQRGVLNAAYVHYFYVLSPNLQETSGVNFINIWRSRFSYESKLSSFSQVTFGFVIFWCQNIGAQCKHKMLMELRSEEPKMLVTSASTFQFLPLSLHIGR